MGEHQCSDLVPLISLVAQVIIFPPHHKPSTKKTTIEHRYQPILLDTDRFHLVILFFTVHFPMKNL